MEKRGEWVGLWKTEERGWVIKKRKKKFKFTIGE